ncbi:hypothetical protein RIF23_18605 [Lipingzhangella sp. LS1_29]|uniref:Uncharacterized protein n=1 Tax=Lipingzhangella rawalii TaxID=2055835 RepID=A0ABU2HBU3_9ACTN|nr:hypothetical protein [Lipingzhangella rawalii]MDS1272304.1 hypothetical protein [Lipingzhangella rawalii]
MKPVSGWEIVMWGSAAVALVCSVIIAVVHDDPIAALISALVAMISAYNARQERRRVQRRGKA